MLNEYCRRLLPVFGVEGLKIRTVNKISGSKRFRELPERGLEWDGKPFAGIVLACTPMLTSAPFDAVYLDKPVARFDLSTVLSVLTRTDHKRRESGVLYDFVSDGKILHELISADFPLRMDDYSEPHSPVIEDLLSQLTESISIRQYASTLTVMEKIAALSSITYERLEKQLAFLFPPEMEQSQLANFWVQNREQLAWKSDLWLLFSRDSTFEWIPAAEEEPVAAEDMEPENVPAALPGGGTPQARGARLERAVKELIRRLFSLSSEDCLQELHIQNSGTQFGFDIGFRYTDRFGAEVNCKIECKDYLDNLIPTGGILEKLFQMKFAREDVDHWILISPNGRIHNDLREMLQKWKNSDIFLPVRDIQNGIIWISGCVSFATGFVHGTICWQEAVSGAIEARLICSHSLVLWTETSGLELIYTPSDKSTVYTKLRSGFVSAICAAALSESEAVICFEYAPGRVKRICASLDPEQERWNFDAEEKTIDCRERIKAIDTDGAEEVYVGTEDGRIIRYCIGSSGIFEPVGSYRLELKCAGAVIDGLHPREQYEILRNAIQEAVDG